MATSTFETGRITRPKIGRELVGRLMDRVTAYEQKRARFDTELARDLEVLNAAFGADLVKSVLAVGTDNLFRRTSGRKRNTLEAAAKELSVSSPPKQKRSRRAKRTHGNLNYGELVPHIEVALDTMKKRNVSSFGTQDVNVLLQEAGVRVSDTTYISLYLRNQASRGKGIRVLERRKDPKRGTNVNVYGFSDNGQAVSVSKPELAGAAATPATTS